MDARLISNAAFPIVAEDVVYQVIDGNTLAATIYRPLGPGKFPGVVSVHGGRWCAETRATNQVIDRALAQRGIVVMAIDFRVAPAAGYPLPVADINFAIRWLKQHAADYQIEPAAIGGIGTSSGGHQLLLNGLLPGDPRYAAEMLPDGEGIDATLAYLVACWPVSDPVARYYHAMVHALHIHIQSHHAYWPDVAAMAEGSPQRIVEEGAATHMPPLLVIQGTDDSVLTPDMADRFCAAYRENGGLIELEKYEGMGHTFITKEPARAVSQAALLRIGDFILAQFLRVRCLPAS
jgi:acetyl esterase